MAQLLEACNPALRPCGRLATNVDVLLMNLSRSVEQLEGLRFDVVNPTVLLRVQKS